MWRTAAVQPWANSRKTRQRRQTWAEIEEDSGIKTSQGRTTEHSALTKLRRNPVLNRFHEEVITYHSYTGTGFAAWKHGGSVEERLVEYLDSERRVPVRGCGMR